MPANGRWDLIRRLKVNKTSIFLFKDIEGKLVGKQSQPTGDIRIDEGS